MEIGNVKIGILKIGNTEIGRMEWQAECNASLPCRYSLQSVCMEETEYQYRKLSS